MASPTKDLGNIGNKVTFGRGDEGEVQGVCYLVPDVTGFLWDAEERVAGQRLKAAGAVRQLFRPEFLRAEACEHVTSRQALCFTNSFTVQANRAIIRSQVTNLGNVEAAKLSDARPINAPAKSRTRSRVSNGTRAFMDADGRSPAARLLRDRERELAEPLGGLPGLSTSERALVESAAALSVRMEFVRSALARGETGVGDEDLVRLSNGLGRALASIERAVSRRTPPRLRKGFPAALLARAEAAE